MCRLSNSLRDAATTPRPGQADPSLGNLCDVCLDSPLHVRAPGVRREIVIGTRVRRLRLARGMTQKELADPKYTYAYVSYIESGRRNPSKEAVEHLASKLGVTTDELLTGRPADLIPKLELRLQEARVAMSEGRVELADETFRSVRKEAKRYHLPRLEAKAEEGLGLWFERRSQPEDALAHHQSAQELLRSLPPTEWVDAVAGMARCFEALGDARYAIFILESHL